MSPPGHGVTRRHLIDSGAYETLAQKIARTPDAAKLIGASHTYLWGNGLIGPHDIRNWPAFAKALAEPSAIAVLLRGTFDKDTVGLLSAARLLPYQQSVLVRAINDGLRSPGAETLADRRHRHDRPRR
ncbi:MAG: hypothetical protein WDN06_04010 [Asticcacaulis sp.]